MLTERGDKYERLTRPARSRDGAAELAPQLASKADSRLADVRFTNGATGPWFTAKELDLNYITVPASYTL